MSNLKIVDIEKTLVEEIPDDDGGLTDIEDSDDEYVIYKKDYLELKNLNRSPSQSMDTLNIMGMLPTCDNI